MVWKFRGKAHFSHSYGWFENFDVYLHTKNHINLSPLTQILQRPCKPVILGTLGTTGYTHQKQYHQLVVTATGLELRTT